MAEENKMDNEELQNEEPVTDTEELTEDAEEVSEAAQTEEAGDEAEESKGFFKKKKDKKDQKDILIEELNDKYRRTMAEFDNFRKRTEKEKATMYEIGAKDIIEKILPVVDNFERGLATIPEDDKATPVAEGMDKIYRQLTKVLEDIGVKEIDACGKEFNPDYHNAVMHVEDEEAGENVIVEEFQKGYLYKETSSRSFTKGIHIQRYRCKT